MSEPVDPLVSTDWLAECLADDGVRVVDGTWRMPGSDDPRAGYLAAHIPGAVHLDIDTLADQKSELPHMLPDGETFAAYVGSLGIGDRHTVVIYDQDGLFSAPRVWWMFRAFGHQRVYVLNGGLPRWRREGRPLAEGEEAPTPTSFQSRFQPQLVRDLADMRTNYRQQREQVVDARPASRFRGEKPESRPGLQAGHIPGAANIPFTDIVTGGEMRERREIAAAFAQAGVDLNKPLVASCGSGVTAAIVALARKRVDGVDMPVYDGSWSEWGRSDLDNPVETGEPDR